MARALIGHTGFVGGTLRRQTGFDHLYNSTNIEQIAGKEYELLACAGAPAAKWIANREPDRDIANLERLMSSLAKTKVRTFVLISTIDVYPNPVDVDEDTIIEPDEGHAYGRHRLRLEHFARDRFDATAIRLPGLFGPGLRKNVIYDLLHDNQLEQVCAQSVFQFYDLEQLWSDVERTLVHGLKLVNFATEPTSVEEVARQVFGFELSQPGLQPPAFYNFKSKHAPLFGGSRGYLYSKAQVLSSMDRFVEAQRKA